MASAKRSRTKAVAPPTSQVELTRAVVDPLPMMVEDPQPLTLRLIVAKRAIADAIEEYVTALVEAHTTKAEYYSQDNSPLGRKRHCRLARSGALKARRVGREWLVKRGDVEAYLESHGRPSPDAETVETMVRRIAG